MSYDLIYAAVIGTAFGITLNRIGATNPTHIVNMVRLTDVRLLKTLIFAVGLACVVLFGGIALDIIAAEHLSIKTAHLGVIAGGMILGLGFVISGLCPGTGLAAMATGRKDAAVFVGGGLVGAFVYALIFGLIKDSFIFDKIAGGKATFADTGNITLLCDCPAWAVALGLGSVLMAVAYFLPKQIR